MFAGFFSQTRTESEVSPFLEKSKKATRPEVRVRFTTEILIISTSSSPLHHRYPDKTSTDEDLLLDDPERRQAAAGRWEEQGDKMKERVPSIPRPIQPSTSLGLTRNVSTKSHLSINSSSSATSGIGSLSTCTYSQPDLSIRPISPIEQTPKLLQSVRDSLVSSVSGSVSIRSRSQREKVNSSKDDKGERPFYRERNISWTNSRLFQMIR